MITVNAGVAFLLIAMVIGCCCHIVSASEILCLPGVIDVVTLVCENNVRIFVFPFNLYTHAHIHTHAHTPLDQ